MLSYRHAFHAGNFADVVKHVIVRAVIDHLCEKSKPFVYVDTHSGAGRYDLRDPHARKNREFETGIGRLWDCRDAPAAVAKWLAFVRADNGSPYLNWYPGSPRLAARAMRAHDRLLLCELHGSEFPALRRQFQGDSRISLLRQDGYEVIRSRLPPREHRGLVLIDPAYEVTDEPRRVLQGLLDGTQRWATGTYLIWYPLMQRGPGDRLARGLLASGLRRVLRVELNVYPPDSPLGMNGTGLFIHNPPWTLEETLKTTLPWLCEHLAIAGQGSYRLDWLLQE